MESAWRDIRAELLDNALLDESDFCPEDYDDGPKEDSLIVTDCEEYDREADYWFWSGDGR